MLNEYLIQKFDRDDPQVAFFGDQYTSDVHWSNCSHPNWHGIAVIEEFMLQPDFEDVDGLEPLDHKLIPYEKYWGDFFVHSPENPTKNWFLKKCAENSRYAVPACRHILNFMEI